MNVKRYPNNPILGPDRAHKWEAQAVFNGCPVKDGARQHLLYRATSYNQEHQGVTMDVSTIGHVSGPDGISFNDDRKQLIAPVEEWEKFGCEDPRVTKIDDTFYIFYTALADYPHTAEGIKIAVALTKDFKTIDERHQVTHFNSKAMALFPERIDGKIVALVTMNTDKPPVRIAMITFDTPEQMWDKSHWDKWLNEENLDRHTIHAQRHLSDHIEIGAPPVKTDEGWVLVYSYIRNYGTEHMEFGIEAALLDLEKPQKVLGRTIHPLITPDEPYELFGMIQKIVFPSGATIQDGILRIYYGGADTVCCLATVPLNELLQRMKIKKYDIAESGAPEPVKLERFEGNPIIEPMSEHPWESKYTLNPTAIYDRGIAHILYRAQDQNDTSFVGYASSKDGLHLDERLDDPIYSPRITEEVREEPGNSGCEDARITKLEGRFHMCYTAFNGHGPARVAYTSISADDFHDHQWNWTEPKLISPDSEYDKNACLVSEKINNKYMFFHRLQGSIWIDTVNDLAFNGGRVLGGMTILRPREESWDSLKVGISGPPIKIHDDQWVLIYHALSKHDGMYRLGAVLLDLRQQMVKARLDYPILEPKTDYENMGLRPGTVFSCGSVVINEKLYVYYGGADQVVNVANVNFAWLVAALEAKRDL